MSGQIDAEPNRSRPLWWNLAVGATTVVAFSLLIRQARGVDLVRLFSGADLDRLAVAVAASLLPLFGAAAALIALSPVRLPVLPAVAVQVATSFANIITPASSGGTALLARFVYRKRVAAPVAAATVALVYATSAVGTCAVIVVATLQTGPRLDLSRYLSAPIVCAVFAAVATVWALLANGRMRSRVPAIDRALGAVRETLRQGGLALRDPARTIGGIFAGLVVLVGSAVTLAACVRVYGAPVPLMSVVLVLTIGTAIGSATPLPGGVGPVEASLAAGLNLAGADPQTALLAVLLYRLLTFWLRVPLGWGCLLWLRRAGHV